MNIKSLALQTGLILDNILGKVEKRSNYVVVTTPDRPNYFWGNYIIMDAPPQKGDYIKWVEIFEKEIGRKEKTGFISLTFDSTMRVENSFEEFIKNGFELLTSKVLIANKIKPPPKYNPKIVCREYSENDWAHYEDVHFTPHWPYGSDQGQREFLKQESSCFRKLVESGLAKRYGAFLDGKMIAELGIFWTNGIVRFNNVGTHPDYRRIGACSTLVYEVSNKLISEMNFKTLVMEADENYHAAKIYEAVGFVPEQIFYKLQWYDKKMF